MKKTILITGAGSGIGMDTVLALAKKGHSVIATTETENQVQNLKAKIKDLNLSIEVFKLDITNQSEVEGIIQYDIDVLIAAAGIGETGSLADIPLDRVRKNFETNVFGTLSTVQTALIKMIPRNKGTIIVISSVAGRIPTSFMSPYSMTKYALSGGMAALRDEVHRVASNVHVSLIEPGAYATGFNQRMFAKKYEWMDQKSYFWSIIPELKKEDEQFSGIELQSTKSIVQKIVAAVESSKPRLRYVAPWYQSLFVQLLRMIGR